MCERRTSHWKVVGNPEMDSGDMNELCLLILACTIKELPRKAYHLISHINQLDKNFPLQYLKKIKQYKMAVV